MLSSSLPSPPPEPHEEVVGQERQRFSLIHTHSPCPGALVHHFILPAQLSLSPLKPSLTRRCHNKPTLAVSPQHPPSFAFLFLHLILHSTLTRTLKYSSSSVLLLIHSSLQATSKPCFIFKPWFSAGVASGPRFYILSNTLPNLFIVQNWISIG